MIMIKRRAITPVFMLMISLLIAGEVHGQEVVEKRVYTTRHTGEAPSPAIDGMLGDDVWALVPWSGDYIEWSPEENTAPTEQTQMKIIYDDRNLYVAFKCLDKDPEGVVRRLSRRDVFDGDWVEINIDSNGDQRTAASFTITAAGVRGEEFITNDGMLWDPTWNPVWTARTQQTAEGWTAEIQIPFSQLRFGTESRPVWGIQSTRRYFREEERSVWQRSPRNAPGWVSAFGELHGLNNLVQQRHWEVQPYTVSSLTRYDEEGGNPFRDGQDSELSAGLDAKIGITNDLTLDLTVNPDFGQVEADPSAIALDGFQIFFPEQRPFFIESKNIFDYKFSTSQSGNTFGFDNLFYSRRIGRGPQGVAQTQMGEFSSQPDVTTILGAAKFSGKTEDGWSVGALNSTTASEVANIAGLEGNRRQTVEPLTNYFVGRLQKDFNNRNSLIGGIFTATNRQLARDVDFLHRAAYTGGIDLGHQWQNKAWYLNGNFVFSYVEGSEAAISATQQSIQHLFNRVDADHLSFDESKTSLSGTGGNVQLGNAAGNWRFESGIAWHTPGLELNDLGFQRRADDLRQYNWVSYRTTRPRERVRQFTINHANVTVFDFGGNLNTVRLNVNGWVNLKNNWWINGGFTYTPHQFSNAALRGGPRLRISPSASYRNGLISDSRKKLRLTLNHAGEWATDGAFRIHALSAALTYQPTNAIQFTLSPNYSFNKDQLQYVATVLSGDTPRYINGTIRQHTLSLPARVDYILSPNLSIQYWGQPFISRGNYGRYKFITDAQAFEFADRFAALSDAQLQDADAQLSVDENLDGIPDYSFFKPDFAFVQWRSNLVLRWEYRQGSELFLVWSQDLVQFGDPADPVLRGLQRTIRDNRPQRIFLLKATYRFLR
ncbi:MAG: DUF5916 domain-containing protein [Bacteroidota bacterium]